MTVTFRQEAPLTLLIERIIDAPRHDVWRCWTETDLLKQWFCPKPWHVPEAEFDLRPGGRMNTVMTGPNGERHENFGIWLEVVPEKRLVFTDGYREGFMPAASHFMTGFVELSDTDTGGTKMTWGARHNDEATLKKHLEMGFEEGWKAASAQLEELAKTLS